MYVIIDMDNTMTKTDNLMKAINSVAEFHSVFQIGNESQPTTSESKTYELRHRLMEEENNEYLEACRKGDIVEIGIDVVKFGKTSLVLKSEVRNMMTRETIISIDNITMVNLGEDGKPKPHGKTQLEFIEDRLKK